METAESLFKKYLQRELNYCLRRFDFETSLRWREQILAQKENIIRAIERDLQRGASKGYYRFLKT